MNLDQHKNIEEMRRVDVQTKAVGGEYLKNGTRQAYARGREDWLDFLSRQEFYIPDHALEVIHNNAYQVPYSNIESTNIFEKMTAVEQGHSHDILLPGYQHLVCLDYSMGHMADMNVLPDKTKYNVAVATGLKNMTMRFFARDKYWEKQGKDVHEIIRKSPVQFIYYFGWTSSRHALGSLAFDTLNEFALQTGEEAYAVIVEDPGHNASKLQNPLDVGKDDFIATTDYFDMTSELYLRTFGFIQDHKVLEETGHSMGGAMVARKSNWGGLVGKHMLAPVWKHKGGNAIANRLILGKGSRLIDKLPSNLKSFAHSQIVPNLSEPLISPDQSDLVTLHSAVFANSDKNYQATEIEQLYGSTEKPNFKSLNLDDEADFIYTFDEDLFINRDTFRSDLDESLGQHKKIHVRLPGPHYGFANDEKNLRAFYHRNRSRVVLNTVQSARHLMKKI